MLSLLIASLCCSLSISPASATGNNTVSQNLLLKKKAFFQRIIDARRDRGDRGGDARVDADAAELRDFISEQVGGLENLIVPTDDADLPQPLLEDGSVDPFFANSPARRFLGQQLFYDPIRTNNIQPEFGGVPETSQTASCGSCHVPEAAGKTGEILNFSVGGEGTFFTDAEGNFNFRRRAQSDPTLFPLLRIQPLFAGDTLIDEIPTLEEITIDGVVVQSGMFDAVDSVPRLTPGLVGFAFNNRLLLGGLAGNPGDTNPNEVTAGNNLTELTIGVHRMIDTQSAALQEIPAYVLLFTEAFPDEAAAAEEADDINLLINDDTVTRAMAAFLRTVVTRDTPWDRFLAGDNSALTSSQMNGARLFFTDPEGGEGGAGCFGCHSGPQLNKQPNDPDVTGMGEFVEENFFNLGLKDHPLFALNGDVNGDPQIRDRGRMNDTDLPENEFQFRANSLRQLKSVEQFMHSGQFSTIRSVVEYFNAGTPSDFEAAASPTFTARFSNPRGDGFGPGLGLTESEVDDLTDFLENGLFDPALIEFDPNSPTLTVGLNEEVDLNYSEFRPDLVALGAVDGFVISGLPVLSNDALTRRDLGLEFLDVGDQIDVNTARISQRGRTQEVVLELSNTSDSVVDTNLIVVIEDLPTGVTLSNASGTTSDGDPFIRIFLDDNNGTLLPNAEVRTSLSFDGVSSRGFRRSIRPVSFSTTFLSGQGTP